MQVTKGRTSESYKPGTAFAPHTGDVLLDAVLTAEGVFVNSAVYVPCARTYWHAHENGQLMLITSGKGTVVNRDGESVIVEAGDVVHTPGGEEHWHGAAPECFVTYMSISLGRTDTLEEVTDAVYSAAWQDGGA